MPTFDTVLYEEPAPGSPSLVQNRPQARIAQLCHKHNMQLFGGGVPSAVFSWQVAGWLKL